MISNNNQSILYYISSIEAPSIYYLRGIDGDRDVTGNDHVRMHNRNLHHRK
jgi:hypothetical protein